MQRDLFAGDHLPMLRCHAALERGDLPGARVALARDADCAGNGSVVGRMAALEEKLPPLRGGVIAPAEAVNEAFENALGRCSEAELRARAAMRQVAPALLSRYLGGLGFAGMKGQ